MSAALGLGASLTRRGTFTGGPTFSVQFPRPTANVIAAPAATLVMSSAPLPSTFALGHASIDDLAMSRLRKFRTWQPNWDGEGAPAPSRLAVDKAIQLLSLLANLHMAFGVDLDSDGRPTFFLRNSRWEGEINLESNGTISFYFMRDREVLDGYELSFDGRRMPADMGRALKAISASR